MKILIPAGKGAEALESQISETSVVRTIDSDKIFESMLSLKIKRDGVIKNQVPVLTAHDVKNHCESIKPYMMTEMTDLSRSP